MTTATMHAPLAAQVRRVQPSLDPLEADLRMARKIATLLDSQFQIAGIRFGLDPIIGLIPGIGDAITAAMGSYLLHIAHKHRLGTGVLSLMVFNLLLDWLIGLIPVVGDLFDLGFKANQRNLNILEKALAKRRPAPLAPGTVTVE